MTMIFRRDGRTITMRHTYGPVTTEITEDASHMGHVWAQLGGILNDNEKPEHGPAYGKSARLPDDGQTYADPHHGQEKSK